MHGQPNDIEALVPSDHPHSEYVLRDDSRLDTTQHLESCFCWDCAVWCNSDLPLCTRFLSWVGGVILWGVGAYEGATFRRWLYPKHILSLGIVNWDSFDGVRLSVEKVRVSNTCEALVFQLPPLERKQSETASKRPVYVFVHGGGFVFASPQEKMFYDYCKYYASKGFVVVSPDYRLAPESPFPAGLEDCLETLRFVRKGEHPLLQSCDVNQVCLGGDSAGGNIALVLAGLIRDGLDVSLKPEAVPEAVPNIKHLVLMYPTLLLPYPTKSIAESDGIMLPYWLSRWMLKSYLPGDQGARQRTLETDRRACPLHAPLAGLPNISLISAELDPFRDECQLLSKELEKQKCKFAHHAFSKVPHGFGTIFTASAKLCQKQILQDMCATLSGQSLPPGGPRSPDSFSISKDSQGTCSSARAAVCMAVAPIVAEMANRS